MCSNIRCCWTLNLCNFSGFQQKVRPLVPCNRATYRQLTTDYRVCQSLLRLGEDQVSKWYIWNGVFVGLIVALILLFFIIIICAVEYKLRRERRRRQLSRCDTRTVINRDGDQYVGRYMYIRWSCFPTFFVFEWFFYFKQCFYSAL